MSSRIVTPEYSRLLVRISPKVIHSEKENEIYTEALYELDQRSASSPARRKNWPSC